MQVGRFQVIGGMVTDKTIVAVGGGGLPLAEAACPWRSRARHRRQAAPSLRR
jgi:hypothetical protein